ncbi:MAG: aldose 1-epimerase family protein [Candidatus Tyrphobacter sp.]
MRSFARSFLEPRTGRIEQIGGITPIVYGDGRARGTRALLVRSGAGLEFECIVDRALDIASASFRGIPLAWHAPGGIAHPAYYAPTGAEFEQNFFGGLLTTCGLSAFGPPGRDEWGTWGQHGRVNHLPAQNVTHRMHWEGDRCVMDISGSVFEYEMFGEALRLERSWRIELGTNRLHLRDRVANDGGKPAPHMLLYHCNAGFPLLDRESELSVSGNRVRPRDAQAERGLGEWNRGGVPQADFEEQVFIHEPRAADGGCAVVTFFNPSLCDGRGLTLSIRFRVDTLPAFFNWRMLGHKTYVMGMEPANCPTVEGRVEARKRGTLPFLQPGETREYQISFEVV